MFTKEMNIVFTRSDASICELIYTADEIAIKHYIFIVQDYPRSFFEITLRTTMPI